MEITDRKGSISPAAALEFEATLTAPTVTDDHPPRVDVLLTNTGPARRLSVGLADGCGLFGGRQGRSYPAGLWLHPTRNREQLHDGTDRFAREHDPFGDGSDGACGTRLYRSGESVRFRLDLWDDASAGGYYPTGSYQFIHTVESWAETEGPLDDRIDPDRRVEWWFRLDVIPPE
jgi:hypothetical protein